MRQIINYDLIVNKYFLIIDLTEAIDVYSEWIDKCEEVNAQENPDDE